MSRPVVKQNKWSGAVMEPLERRQLLSADLSGLSEFALSRTQPFVDLTGEIVKIPVKPVAIIARHSKPVSVTVLVSNAGNETAIGSFAISLYAGTQTTLHATDVFLTTRSFGRVSIRAGKSRSFVVAAVPTTAVPSGTFHLIAHINATGGISENNTANDVASSLGTVVLNNPLIAPGPVIVGALASNASTVSLNESQSVTFTQTVGRAGPSSSVQVHQFDAQGNDLGAVATMYDDGGVASDGDATANDGIYTGMATIDAGSLGSQFYGVVITDPQLTRPLQGTSIMIAVVPPPPPTFASALSADTAAVVVGVPVLSQFHVSVANADPQTTVTVHEYDAAGNDLGTFATLADDGLAASGDAVAGDSVFNGANAVSFTAPGTRYFAAVVTDPTLTTPLQSATIDIPGVNPTSPAQFAADAADDANLSQLTNSVLASGGTIQGAVSALNEALVSDANVVSSSIVTQGSGIFWKNIDGTAHQYGGDTLAGSGNDSLGGSSPPRESAVQSGDAVTGPAGSSTLPHSGSNALVLAPFASDSYDLSSNVASQLQAAGYNVTFHSDGAVSLDDFKNFGTYDTIAIHSHGGLGSDGSVIFATGVSTSAALNAQYSEDLSDGALVKVDVPQTYLFGLINGTREVYAITPTWVYLYDGGMNGTIVDATLCDSLANDSMANAFLGGGTAAYLGYSNTVSQKFDQANEVAAYTTLLQTTGNTVGDIPGIDSAVDPYGGYSAKFVKRGSLAATLPTALLLKNENVYVQYNWPENVRDLDSNTGFLGASVGYALPGSSYLNWSGDDTGSGGQETTTVDVYQAWVGQAWASTTTVTAGMDWYTPAGGSGPAYLTIGLQDRTTGAITSVTKSTIAFPGQETNGAMDVNASIAVTLGGDMLNPTVKISVSLL